MEIEDEDVEFSLFKKKSGKKPKPEVASSGIEEEETPQEKATSSAVKNVEAKAQPRKTTFETLGLALWINTIATNIGLKEPTPIQCHAIPYILEGRDYIGCAPTGSGKTAAFVLPIIHTLSIDPYGIYTLVISPTRELSEQTAEQFVALGDPIKLRVCRAFGGGDMVQQRSEISKKPHVLIASPGRLIAHLERDTTISLKRIRYLVIDEADQLINNENFQDQMEIIFSFLPKNCQTLLFSATMASLDLDKLSFLNLKDPVTNPIEETRLSLAESLTQQYLFIPETVRDVYLVYLLRLEEAKAEERLKKLRINPAERDDEDLLDTSIIIFTSSRRATERLWLMLKELGIKTLKLHGLMEQFDRVKTLRTFKNGTVNVLVTTDIANRGLDIPSVELVINYNFPMELASYIHRVGRTARAGREGRALSMVCNRKDVNCLLKVEKAVGTTIDKLELDEAKALLHMDEVAVAKAMAETTLFENEFDEKDKKKKLKSEEEIQEVRRKKTEKMKKEQEQASKTPTKRKIVEEDTPKRKKKINDLLKVVLILYQ